VEDGAELGVVGMRGCGGEWRMVSANAPAYPEKPRAG
jgi:hypothetical protein